MNHYLIVLYAGISATVLGAVVAVLWVVNYDRLNTKD